MTFANMDDIVGSLRACKSTLPAIVVSIGILYVIIGAIRRVYFSPLSKFPGSKLAALTLWNEFYWDIVKRGTFIWRIEEMHKKYGPIVRVNPYEIHIMDSDFYDDLYSIPKLDKYRWWTNLAGADGSGFSTVPHELHRIRRGAIAPFFSARSVSQLEPMLKEKIEKLSARFDQIAQTGEIVRLDAAFMALTMDIICRYAFASDRGYLDKPDFELKWKETILGAFEGGALGRQFPWMLPFMKRLPISIVEKVNPVVAHLFTWQEIVKQAVTPILEEPMETRGKEGKDKTIFHTLRDSDLPEEEKTLQRLCDEGEILTGAGSDTTAQALTRTLFYLKWVPGVLAKVREELDTVVVDRGVIPSWNELQGLPYFGAVIKEGLRLSYGVTTRLPRVAKTDITYKGYVIPAGTPVSQTIYFVLVDPVVFPEPTEFRPERWLDPNNRLDKYLMAFGRGTRQCLGMNLAQAELHLTLATVVSRFDWELYETGLRDVICDRDFFVAVGHLESKGVRARLALRR